MVLLVLIFVLLVLVLLVLLMSNGEVPQLVGRDPPRVGHRVVRTEQKKKRKTLRLFDFL